MGIGSSKSVSLSKVTTTGDEITKEPKTTFKEGETVFAVIEVQGETDGIILECYFDKADVDTKTLSGSKFAGDLKGEKEATCYIKLSKGWSPGKYAVIARLVKTTNAKQNIVVTEMKKVFEVR